VFTLRKELADKVHIAIPNKILTYDLVNKFTNEQMLLFVDTFGKGDGHKRKTGEWTISQKHKDTLDIMQYMLTINGVKSSITFNGVNHLNILKSKRTAVVNLDKEVKSVRTVWCPTTNTGMWIARKNGRVFITGNSAPFKPMFANTAFGKIATRFQLWAWNNVRLKNNIINDAHKYGFREGTEAYSRFQRMATMDLLAVGLANAFMYSIFESALPAPWNWVQDMGDWVFGDEKEKEKAFFGAYPTEVAPLQMITPPALRMMPPMIKALIRNDASVISDYHIWTMFPFGRIGRDIFGKGNVMENPYQIIEKTTGIPYREISRSMVETRGTKPFVGGY